MTAARDDGFSNDDARAIHEASKHWTAEQRAMFLDTLETAAARKKIVNQYRDATDLAATLDPGFRVTPALRIIGRAIETCLTKPNKNVLITMPPQEGKSTSVAVYGTLRALQLNPHRKVVLASYGDDLAHTHSRRCRQLIRDNGRDVRDAASGALMPDKLGIKLKRGSNQIKAWEIQGSDGGLYAAGIGASITGRPADLFIIDDPYKSMAEADSSTIRRKVDEWFANVVTTRLAPGAPIILIQTRWHPEDLAGKVIAAEADLPSEQRTWRHINIPAISEIGIPDALHRPQPGTPMQSARDGYDQDGNELKRDFPVIRRRVGERVWYALYQGSPRNPAGGLFLRAWFEDRRLSAPPLMPIASIIAIDPADSGTADSDETGIIAGSLTPEGLVALTHDRSAQMTSDKWSRTAVQLALETGAREIIFEGYTTATTYKMVIKRAYEILHEEAVTKHNTGALLTPTEQRALPTQPPFIIKPWTGRGDAVARSGLLRQACENGTCRTVEHALAVFEDQACDWQTGQHQPDRVAAAIIAHDRLAELGNGRGNFAAPIGTRPTPTTPSWLRRRITDPKPR